MPSNITQIRLEDSTRVSHTTRDPQTFSEPIIIDADVPTAGETYVLTLSLDAAEELGRTLRQAVDEVRAQIPVSTQPDPDDARDAEIDAMFGLLKNP